MANVFFIYILECSNGAYYTGYTTDMQRRYAEHQQGSARCKYTRSFPPRRIAACWQIEADLSLILKIERQIKSLSKKEKIGLIEQPDLRSQLPAKLGLSAINSLRP